MTRFFFSSPAITRSTAASNDLASTAAAPHRAAIKAASLHTLATSAPEKPGVSPASFFATPWIVSPSASFRGSRCTPKVSSRPLMSGLSTTTWRSKRPGRRSAESRTSGRLVPASTTIPVLGENPSSSMSRAFKVFSRSSFPPEKPPLPRARPTASISSMKMRHGALARACANRSRTRDGPTPTNISMKSEPDIE